MSVLDRCEPTIPAEWYFDPTQFTREINAIWYHEWVCIGRAEDWPNEGDYRAVRIGTQNIIVTRDGDGWHAFHNTCRHRGSILCEANSGRFRNGRIVCPYHAWTYGLDGKLLATPHRLKTDDFDPANYSLYAVAIGEWGGYVFINLDEHPRQAFEEFLGDEAKRVAHWPLADMVSVQQDRHPLACNWKIFWENYMECYHCPKVHPELCHVVPVYKKALIARHDEPGWTPEKDGDTGEPTVAEGMHTWTLDGQSRLPIIDGLTKEEQEAGMTFATFTPTMFVVVHRDYARSVRVVPIGPEQTELVVDWLLLPATRDAYADEIPHMLGLARRVVAQDGKACELNQAGLRSLRHESGVLVPQEHGVWEFQEWLRERLVSA